MFQSLRTRAEGRFEAFVQKKFGSAKESRPGCTELGIQSSTLKSYHYGRGLFLRFEKFDCDFVTIGDVGKSSAGGFYAYVSKGKLGREECWSMCGSTLLHHDSANGKGIWKLDQSVVAEETKSGSFGVPRSVTQDIVGFGKVEFELPLWVHGPENSFRPFADVKVRHVTEEIKLRVPPIGDNMSVLSREQLPTVLQNSWLAFLLVTSVLFRVRMWHI